MPPPPPQVVASAATTVPSVPTGTEKVGDYSHFNNKLTIADFDLLKVSIFKCFFAICYGIFVVGSRERKFRTGNVSQEKR